MITLAEKTEELFSRQALMFDEEQLMRRCVILGCGFIGSNLAHNLMKTGFQRFLLLDFDTVGVENLLNQNYGSDDVGLPKTQALANHLIESSPLDMDVDIDNDINNIINGKLELFDGDILFLSADKLKIRKDFVQWLLNKQSQGELTDVILVTVGTNEEMITLSMIQHDIEALKTLLSLYSGDESEFKTGVCGNKSAYFMGSLVSGLVVSFLKNKFLGRPHPVNIMKLWLNDESVLLSEG